VCVLKASYASLQEQLQSLSETTDSERTGLKNEKDRWEGKAKGFMKTLEDRKKDFERAENVTNGLKTQVEGLRDELKASQKAFRDKMDMDKVCVCVCYFFNVYYVCY
jgi:predicted  nucleic acid-binding Zn-ribbon protein